jgi:hypothetical protein
MLFSVIPANPGSMMSGAGTGIQYLQAVANYLDSDKEAPCAMTRF